MFRCKSLCILKFSSKISIFLMLLYFCSVIWKWKCRDIRSSMVTHTRNSCSAFNPSKVHTHSSEHTHTHREHTPGAVGSHLCCGVRGAVGGSVPCSRAPQSWYWGWRECCTFTPPTYNPCRTWDSNSQTLDYESDSLTITGPSPRGGIRGQCPPKWLDVPPCLHEHEWT